MKKVEQVINGLVIEDYDERIPPKDIRNILLKNFSISTKQNPFVATLGGSQINLFVKQVTYLGHPHPTYKKRIQISLGWNEKLREPRSFLIGLYKYRTTLVYVVFDTTNFIERRTNNSSAHVSTLDIRNACHDGVFDKVDNQGNKITLATQSRIVGLLEKLVRGETTTPPNVIPFRNFKSSLGREYHGITCYQEMMSANFKRGMNQAEWFGWYIEFRFKNYLDEYPNFKRVCEYQGHRGGLELDFDLVFSDGFLGDLKSHSLNRGGGVPGNDKSGTELAIKRHGKLWYVIISHNTVMDKDCGYEVTKWWNDKLGKQNNMSYARRMKNSVILARLQILEIDKFNAPQLFSDFNQGRQSSGEPRKPKYKISKTSINNNNFLVYNSVFDEK